MTTRQDIFSRLVITGKTWSERIKKHSRPILWIFIISYIILFSGFCLYKYFTYNYIGLDLAIYNQVFFNSSQGDLFSLTIHPHSYLGDHFELIILFFLPLYFLIKSPVSLLILQTAVLAFGAYPLYLIARKKLGENLSLLLGLLYLSNVFVQNTNSYEFHILPFAIPLFFLFFYYYLEEKFGLFLLFLILTLLVREDAALVVLAFSFFALIEKKSWKWIVVPFVIGLAWFIFATKITGYFSGYGQYKFILYYGWLGQDLKSIILNFFGHPWLVLKHLFSGDNIVFLAGLFLPFGFLPLIKIKYLLPVALIIFQILMLGSGGPLALEIHYTSLIIPFLFIGLVFALEKILYRPNKGKLLAILQKERSIFLTIVVIIAVYSSLYAGSAFWLAKDFFGYPKIKEEVRLRNDFVSLIDRDTPVATGFQFIPRLSGREKIYSLHYQYLGKKQYSSQDYRIPPDAQTLLFDFSDFNYYHYLYREDDENNIGGAQRMRELISANDFCLNRYLGKFLLYTKDCLGAESSPYAVIKKLPAQATSSNIDFNNAVKLAGLKQSAITTESINDHAYRLLPLSLYWRSEKKISRDYQMTVKLEQNSKIVWQDNYPLSAFYPTHDWLAGELIEVNYKFLIPASVTPGDYQLKISLYNTEGKMGLSKDKIFRPFIKKSDKLGEITPLWITL
ncbi:MAG: DUF2079 domain-containing protein [Patescibacteria group bacterium]